MASRTSTTDGRLPADGLSTADRVPDPHDVRCAARLRAAASRSPGSAWPDDDGPGAGTAAVHDLARLIAEHCGHRLLKAHRLARGWTVREAVAQAVSLDGRPRGLAERSWLAWESGAGLSREYQDLLCRLFRTGPVQLGLAVDHTPRPVTAPVTSVRPAASSTDLEVEMAASESARFLQFAEQANVGPHTVEQLHEDLRRIVTVYPNRPVEPLFVELRALRDRVFALLEGRQPPAQTRELYLVAGTVCGVMANASFDLGAFAPARTQSRTAFLCAELAGHNGLRAWIRGTQSLMAYWDDRPALAVSLLRDGARYRPEQGTAAVRLHALEARAHGRLGDRSEAEAALARAEAERDRAAGADDPGGMMAFPRAKQDYVAATTRLWLGEDDDVAQAERYATAAVLGFESDPVEQRRVGELNLARADLAAARLRTGEVDGATRAVVAVLHAAAERPIESVTRRLRQLASLAARPGLAGSREAAELRDRIEDSVAHRPARAAP